MEICVHATPENNKTILDLLEEQGIHIPCNCHGTNACGGHQYPFPCGNIPHADTTITLPETAQSLHGLSLDSAAHTKANLPDTVLIDLGTTTIALVFWNSIHKTIYHSQVFANPQTSYGADIISRIKYDMEFHEEYTLTNILCNSLTSHCQVVLSRCPAAMIQHCFIGGNTTMIHLLLGLPTKGLGQAPFIPYDLPDKDFSFLTKEHVHVHILPWLSAFIGGDVVAGLLSLHFDQRKDTCLLADLGTNGELVLCHRGSLYMTSTAAGPVFEGASLSSGCPAIPGAISDVSLGKGIPKLQTIGNKYPTGICGSGAISLLAELISTGLMLPSGILSEYIPQEGLFLSRTTPTCKAISNGFTVSNGFASSHSSICLTREDIRQIQLATAAIGAGIDTLCLEAGITPRDLDHLYLAGGLGYHINIKKAYLTGLFSDTEATRITSVGNSCLQGLAALSSDLGADAHATQKPLLSLRHSSKEIVLAHSAYFQKQFIRHMTYDNISTV